MTNVFAEPNTAKKQDIPELPSQPVWENMKPAAEGANTKKTNKDTGFVKPPPANENKNTKTKPANHQLIARIIPANPTVKQGDSVTFSLETNQQNLKYYWVSGGIKSAKSSFIVNTANLKLGKYRVRATATNDKRHQAHASAFFTVVDTTTDTGLAPDQKIKPAPPLTDTNNGPDSVNSVNTTSSEKAIELPIEIPAPDATSDPAENTQIFRLEIVPSLIKVGPNENIFFKSNVKLVDDYAFNWKFANTHSETEVFEISSGNLKPGRYLVHLAATNAENQTVKAQAMVHILSEASDQVATAPTDNKVATPDFVGTAFSDLRQQLTSQHFVLGSISERSVKEGADFVIEQSPTAGSRILPGSVINVVVGISSIVSVPDLFGLQKNTVKQQLAHSSLVVGKITKKINNRSIGLVLDQNPKAGSSLDRGSPVDLVMGIATPKPLQATIQPSSAVVEKGESVELTPVIVEPEVDNNLSFQWTLGDLSSTDRVFEIDTSELSLGDHRVRLLVKNTYNQKVSAESVIKVTAQTIQMPNITGEDIDFARTTLENMGLKLGDIQRLPREIAEETVLEQSPSVGQKVLLGSSVQLVVAIPKSKEESVITLSADADEVKAGETVTFVLQISPKPENSDIHYVYTINKGASEEKKANVRSSLRWTPEKEGIYTVVVAAFSNKGIIAKSSAVTITVNPVWEKPVAKIIPQMVVVIQGDNAEFVSTSTYDLNSSLNYVWESETEHKSVQKQFSFDTSEITPGSYTIKLTVIDDQSNESSSSTMLVVQAGVNSISRGKTDSSQAETGVAHTGSPNKSQNSPTIKLMASKRFIGVGSSTNIKVVSSSSLSNVHYYFETGDGINTEWIATSEIEHKYDAFGAYRVRAAVKRADKVFYSDNLTIWVFSPLLFIIMGGLAGLTYLFMWWWTKRIPASKNNQRNNNQESNQEKSQKSQEHPVHSMRQTQGAQDRLAKKTAVIEQQVPLKQDDNDIVTESRSAQRLDGTRNTTLDRTLDRTLDKALDKTLDGTSERTIASVLKRAILQFILGILLSVLVIYLILKAMGLI